ncbi:type IV toxin-antitoxin system AbiEi family antitoxin domain-containing protein [Streptomyces sp. NBC_00162]|uniref:type IV toxin-antitoxin system AbiEi family antitoxin domain-containing protein n=1 Tax=Streptomyces sp. NBC_00162 TaxID=2903629 RepID=UPI00214BCFF9|nr:type IV toxin-antitoxin system AbiEi family antitoxin domain-containing protein [Streptomyces sp. NBC_00162]UUU45173.1 type IV toxin-antitoxin system AbiEi family antitoxin domain-containing protein [Streptomyces sp. NBC_00162]
MERSEAIRQLGAIAADQWGLVTARQAQAAGLSRVDLTRLIDAELLLRSAHGIYQLAGATPTSHLDIKAAWLRLDPATLAWERPLDGDRAAVVSYASACQLHDIGDIPADNVEISVPVRRTTRENGVILHKAAIPSGDMTFLEGLPVTTVDRTICDLLRSRADGGHIGRVLADADQRGLTDTRALAERVQPYARAYGLPKDASGADLLNFLAEEAGFTLRDEQITAAGARAISTIEEALIAHGTRTPGLAAAYEAVAARTAGLYRIDQATAEAIARGPSEAVQRALAQIALQSPGQAYLDAMKSATSIAAQVAALQDTATLAERFAEAAANSPAVLAAEWLTKPMNTTSPAVRAAQLATPTAELDAASPESEDEDAEGGTPPSE